MSSRKVQNWNMYALGRVQGGSIVIGINADFRVTVYWHLSPGGCVIRDS